MQTLTVINKCLRAIGMSPLSSADQSNRVVAQVTNLLTEVTDEVLSQGWDFNSETFTLTADIDGEIAAGADWLVAKAPTGYELVDGRIRYLEGNTFVIPDDAQPMEIDVVLRWEFTQIPEHVARWVAARTVHDFALSKKGFTATVAKLGDKADQAELAAHNDDPGNIMPSLRAQAGRTPRTLDYE